MRTLVDGHAGPRYLAVLLLVAGLAVGCSEDDDVNADSGAPDKGRPDMAADNGPAPDQKTAAKEASVDVALVDASSTADLSKASRIRKLTEDFVKAQANKLPSSASTAKVETFVLKDNEAKGWVEDTSTGKTGVEAGYTKKDIEALIDGSHDPYAAEGCTGFAWQHFVYGTTKLELKLWHMNATTGAQNMFSKKKKEGTTQDGLTFSTVSGVKDQAIIADDQPMWRVYAQKGPYIFKVEANYMF